MVVGRAVTHKPPCAPIDLRVEVDLQRPVDMAAEAEFAVLFAELDARPTGPQRVQDFTLAIADGGDDAQAGDYHPSHGRFDQAVVGAFGNSPTRNFFASWTFTPSRKAMPSATASVNARLRTRLT
jgi:hypothetical protein